MQFSVTFRHMEASEAVREYAREKVERIKKYFPDPISAHVVVSTERGYQHHVDVNIQLHNGLAIKGAETTEDMYSSIDLVMAKIERQVRRYKEKIRHHKPRTHLSDIPYDYSVISTEDQELEQATEAGPRVVKTEQLAARPFTVDEAVMQMNLLGGSFFVFRNIATGDVNVVYRLSDGNYGLVEAKSSTLPKADAKPADGAAARS